jgi:hypothetical protein
MRRLPVISILAVSAFFTSITEQARSQGEVPRPPQYVALAFDGSSSIEMWNTTRRFANDAKAAGAPLKFTYFISGVYYVGKANKRRYIEPTRGPGVSAIGWGSDDQDLLARYDQTNLAFKEEHEIASHANGHFSGDKWGFKEWQSEFRQFHEIIFDFLRFNGLRPTPAFPNGWIFKEQEMKGFRAPQLGVSQPLWDVIKDFGYRYDTSLVAKANYWPEKHARGGHWNFPLAALTIAGTGKRTLSMDYNFYVADSAAQPNAAQKDRFKKQMLETYLQYFDSNYNGNRAPLHIGHHFSLWNGGAYWEAMKEFALTVCKKPEVVCGTYKELADFMDKTPPETVRAYREGRFPKAQGLRLSQGLPVYDLGVRIAQNGDGYAAALSGRDARDRTDLRVEYRVDGKRVSGKQIRSGDFRSIVNRSAAKSTARIEARVFKGLNEIARATQVLSHLGEVSEVLTETPLEARALLGDLPEAHAAEGEGLHHGH